MLKRIVNVAVFLFSDKVKAIPESYQVQVKVSSTKSLSKWEQSNKEF
jgi:hypothetical protein